MDEMGPVETEARRTILDHVLRHPGAQTAAQEGRNMTLEDVNQDLDSTLKFIGAQLSGLREAIFVLARELDVRRDS